MRTGSWFDSREPSNVLSARVIVNGGSIASALSYGLREGHDPLHLFRLGEVGRVDQHRVLGLNGLRGVLCVAMNETVGLLRDLRFGRAATDLLRQPASGPLRTTAASGASGEDASGSMTNVSV